MCYGGCQGGIRSHIDGPTSIDDLWRIFQEQWGNHDMDILALIYKSDEICF